jgi:hypothetical protein
MTPEPISTAYFINPSHQSLCLYVYPPIVARHRLGKNVTAAKNARTAIEEFFGEYFSMRSLHIKGKYEISSSQNFLSIYVFYEAPRL